MTAVHEYSFRAARFDGTLETGVLVAESREAVNRALGARGLWTLEVQEARRHLKRTTRISAADLALGLRVLATLLESGLPVGRALVSMSDIAPNSWTPFLPGIVREVNEGASLGSALERCRLAIPALVVGIVRAGEVGSGLAKSVRRAASVMEESAATRTAVRAALLYPCILALTGTVSVAILVGVVLPRFGAMLADLGQKLPPTTRFVLRASSLASATVLPFTFIVVMALAAWRVWLATDSGAARWHHMLLKLPYWGAIRWSAGTARACAALAALLESGVPVSSALMHAARASGDAALAKRILAARTAVIAGARPSAAFLAEDALTAVAVRLVRAGEETGALSVMLAHAAHLEGERAIERVRSAVRLIEPGLILLFGGLVALVATALLQAVYSVRPT